MEYAQLRLLARQPSSKTSHVYHSPQKHIITHSRTTSPQIITTFPAHQAITSKLHTHLSGPDSQHQNLLPLYINPAFSPPPSLLPTNPPIALSIPLTLLTTACTPTGATFTQSIHLAYNGSATTQLLPPSIAAMTSFATSTGSSTGPKNPLGVFTPSKSGVESWPGVTSTVLMLG